MRLAGARGQLYATETSTKQHILEARASDHIFYLCLVHRAAIWPSGQAGGLVQQVELTRHGKLPLKTSSKNQARAGTWLQFWSS